MSGFVISLAPIQSICHSNPMRRWLLRLSITLLILLILAIVAVQVVLTTNLPRDLVLGEVQKTLGLQIGAESLGTGWWGRTSLHNVTLSLPLAGESFLRVKSLKVKHTILPAILFGRPVKLQSLEFESPELMVRQDSSGRWNLAQVIDLIRRAGGGQQAADTADAKKTDRAEIPQIAVRSGTINIIDRTGQIATLHRFNLSGVPQGSLVWRYEASVGPVDQPQMHLVGKLAPGGDWQHEVSLTLYNLEPTLRPWLANVSAGTRNFIEAAELNGQWRGTVNQGVVSGQLQLAPFRSGPTSAKGVLNIEYKAGALSIRPRSLVLAGVPKSPSEIAIKSGAIVIEGTAVRTENLIVNVAAGDMLIASRYDWSDQSGDLNAEWHNLIAPADFAQNGSLVAHARSNFPGIRRVEATMTSQATSPKYKWDTAVKINGTGKSLAEIHWDIIAEKLRLTQTKFTANLDGLTAKFEQSSTKLTLAQVTVPEGTLAPGRPRGSLSGQGYYHFPDAHSAKGGDWWFLLNGLDWRLSESAAVKTQFSLDISGDLNAPQKQDWARIKDFYARTDTGVQVSATGSISYRAAGCPAELWLYTWYPPFTLNAYDAGMVMKGGEFRSAIHLRGGAWPFRLDLDGDLDGHDIFVRGRRIGNVALILKGTADSPAKGDPLDYVIKINTEKLHLLEGFWNIRADYNHATRLAEVMIDLQNLPLAQADNFLNASTRLRGSLSGSWTIQAPQFHFDQLKIDTDAPWKITGFAVGSVSADDITGEIHADGGTVSIDHIVARKKTGGQINATSKFRLKTPSKMQLTASASAWPVELPGVSLLAYAQTVEPIEADVRAGDYRGAFKLDVYPVVRGADAGIVRTEGNINGRAITLSKIDGQTLDGTISGTASYDFGDLMKARANLQWKQLDGGKLATMFPDTEGVSGRFDGSLDLGPARNPRPLGPLQLDLKISANQGKWRALSLKSADLTAYYDRNTTNHEERFVIDNSYLTIAGGDIRVFARASKHPLDRQSGPLAEWSLNLDLDGRDIDLNQLVHVNGPDAPNTPGKLETKFTLLGNPADRTKWVGQGSVRLTESELADNVIIGTLYRLMSVKLGPNVPTGKGNTTFRMENGNLDITGFYYFNRGIEARGTGRISDVWQLGNAELSGFVIGSVRPLKDLKIPFAADLDQILTAFQRGATTVRIAGTIQKPKADLALFGDITQGLRTLILGDVNAETRSTAGQ